MRADSHENQQIFRSLRHLAEYIAVQRTQVSGRRRGRLQAAAERGAFRQPCGFIFRFDVGRRGDLPLLSHDSPTAVVAYRGGGVSTRSNSLPMPCAWPNRLPRGRHVLNVCVDRYHFTVGLAACLISDRISLLPSTHTPEVVRQLGAVRARCVLSHRRCALRHRSSPLSRMPARMQRMRRSRGAVPYRVPQIPPAQLAAIVFTSGSTGTPLPYKKTWGRLTRCLRESGRAARTASTGATHTLIGTVPPQHMYGFETTVLLALLSGNAFHRGAAVLSCRYLRGNRRGAAAASVWSRPRSTCARCLAAGMRTAAARSDRLGHRTPRAGARARGGSEDSAPDCSRFTDRRKRARSRPAAPPNRSPGACCRTCASAPTATRQV